MADKDTPASPTNKKRKRKAHKKAKKETSLRPTSMDDSTNSAIGTSIFKDDAQVIFSAEYSARTTYSDEYNLCQLTLVSDRHCTRTRAGDAQLAVIRLDYIIRDRCRHPVDF